MLSVQNNTYSKFKPYQKYLKPKIEAQKDKNIKALAGAAIGVGGALLLSKKYITDKTIPQKTLREVAKMLAMASAGNIGGVLGGSIGANRQQKKKKWKEAAFQMMNTTIPMLLVSGTLEAFKRIKPLSGKLPRALGSIAAMVGGAALATTITNATKGDNEPKRKYTIKDSVANFDDIVATLAIGFEDLLRYVPVDKILPFIYIYCGSRAGDKE